VGARRGATGITGRCARAFVDRECGRWCPRPAGQGSSTTELWKTLGEARGVLGLVNTGRVGILAHPIGEADYAGGLLAEEVARASERHRGAHRVSELKDGQQLVRYG